MADGIVDIKGIKETQQQLEKFSVKLADRIILLALRSGANFMLKQIRQAQPKRTGRLRRATVVKTSRINRRRRNGRVGVYITIKAGKKRNDPKGAYYGRFVEGGYKRGSKKVAGKFFVRNTFNTTKKQSLELVIKNIESAGKKLSRKLK